MPPDVCRQALFEDPQDAVRDWQPPDLGRPGCFDDMKRDLAEKSGDFLVVPSGYAGIWERGYFLMGFQEFMVNMALKPRLVHDLLDKITDCKVALARKVVGLGFKVAHHGDDLGTQGATFFSPKMFREFLLPRLKRAWQPYNDVGLPIIMHACGCVTDFLPDLIAIGLRVLEPVQPCMDLEYLKREFGKDLVFWGGIETQNILPFGRPEEVKAMARRTIRTLGRGGGHIIAPSQEMMNDVPIANVKALVETIIEERQRVLDV
jgi:uroporphyrinogen decarboxylase